MQLLQGFLFKANMNIILFLVCTCINAYQCNLVFPCLPRFECNGLNGGRTKPRFGFDGLNGGRTKPRFGINGLNGGRTKLSAPSLSATGSSFILPRRESYLPISVQFF